MVALDGTWLNMVAFVWIAITALVVVAQGKQGLANWIGCVVMLC